MTEISPAISKDLAAAFLDYERRVRISNYKIACIMAFIFMPAGASLDYFVCPSNLGEFLLARLLCSALLALIWGLLQSRVGIKFYRFLGFLVAFLPMAFISWMIYQTEGPNSPYYAGLNLVMLGAALLLRWTFFDSILVFLLSIATYTAACLLNGKASESGAFFNNIYFLFVTGCFIITGSWFYNRIRFREFVLRYQLDKSRHELEETNRKLIELDRLKSRFFANISHELRTPLTLLLSPLETLLQRFAGQTDQAVHDLLLTMHSNGMRLLKLINDLLDLIRLEAGRMEIKNEPMEVADFIQGLASAARQVADDKQIKLETYTDLRLGAVAADPDKLEKVVLNLLFNALKFTPEGGRVELRAEKQGEELVLIVNDTGIGIAEKNLPFVFDRFWQADSSAQRKYQGVGIGLALVKELAEMMRG
ncbi:MAG TPA: HAMP domain-containing sensor histidine kinase, partial [Candidatus Saccharimonadales bacterium]|nr:HAMP domain-containing sensor histidine kinase [Candidatus Saccharimonadales bacterium]